VAEEVGILTTGIFQGVAEHGEAGGVEVACMAVRLLLNGFG
jgi:hypothetical protein